MTYAAYLAELKPLQTLLGRHLEDIKSLATDHGRALSYFERMLSNGDSGPSGYFKDGKS
jgi:hypothetical protein